MLRPWTAAYEKGTAELGLRVAAVGPAEGAEFCRWNWWIVGVVALLLLLPCDVCGDEVSLKIASEKN